MMTYTNESTKDPNLYTDVARQNINAVALQQIPTLRFDNGDGNVGHLYFRYGIAHEQISETAVSLYSRTSTSLVTLKETWCYIIDYGKGIKVRNETFWHTLK